MADLELWLDARGSGVRLAVPVCHTPFLAAADPGTGLALRVRDGPLERTDGWQSLFYDAETWQLWRDGAGRTVFVAPRHSPPHRQVAVDAAFRTGEVIGQFSADLPPGQAVYPLLDLDIMLVANWLAESGDLILHAAGVEDEGTGYVFVGPAGAGKSTLVASLSSTARQAAEATRTSVAGAPHPAPTNDNSLVGLGEDQVIVRYQDSRFLVYGTPWHTNPARCSPGGAPLRKIFFLDRFAGHGVEPCGRMAGVERLLQDAFIPYYNRTGVEHILETLPRLAEQVPFYTLGFEIGGDVMKLIRGA